MNRKGSVLVEFIFGFPLILVMMLAVFQFAQFEIARLVIHYAAYCGARAALVHHEDEAAVAVSMAVQRVCAWITLYDYPQSASEGPPITIPGWGDIPNSEATAAKTEIKYRYRADQMAVEVEVNHDFILVAPVIGQIMAKGLQWWGEAQPDETVAMFTTEEESTEDDALYPTCRIWAKCVMTKPYTTIYPTGLPAL